MKTALIIHCYLLGYILNLNKYLGVVDAALRTSSWLKLWILETMRRRCWLNLARFAFASNRKQPYLAPIYGEATRFSPRSVSLQSFCFQGYHPRVDCNAIHFGCQFNPLLINAVPVYPRGGQSRATPSLTRPSGLASHLSRLIQSLQCRRFPQPCLLETS